MRIACTLLLYLVATLNSIGSSSQSNPAPDEGSDLGSHHSGPSSTSPRGIEPPLSGRLKSLTLRQTFPSILGFKFKDLEFIRLSPHNNRNRIFELRRYVFPPDGPTRLRTRGLVLIPMPTAEQLVLSTPHGVIFALLEKKLNRNTILRAIFTPAPGESKRVKINIDSGEIEEMTAEEIAGCPVSPGDLVMKNYEVFRLNAQSRSLPANDPPSSVQECGPSSSSSSRRRSDETHSLAAPHRSAWSAQPVEPLLRDRSRSPTLRQTFPILFGFEFEKLAFIRLSPKNNQNRIFEIRRYVFPPDKPIRLRTRNRGLIPMPTGEQLVLSTPDGDILAILEKTTYKKTILRAIFTPVFEVSERAKMNMNTGTVEELTMEEIADCPIASKEAVSTMYRIFRV